MFVYVVVIWCHLPPPTWVGEGVAYLRERLLFIVTCPDEKENIPNIFGKTLKIKLRGGYDVLHIFSNFNFVLVIMEISVLVHFLVLRLVSFTVI